MLPDVGCAFKFATMSPVYAEMGFMPSDQSDKVSLEPAPHHVSQGSPPTWRL